MKLLLASVMRPVAVSLTTIETSRLYAPNFDVRFGDKPPDLSGGTVSFAVAELPAVTVIDGFEDEI